MKLDVLLPRGGGDVETWLAQRHATATPFHSSVVDACADLSQRIMRDPEARQYPELLALAFWIRKAELTRLAQEFAALARPGRLLTPRGLVFHMPPRNVDTMFVYSWLLSALTGNRNVIRLSPLRSQSTNVLLRLFSDALENAAEPARSATMVVNYGHEEAATALLSAACDVRVIWGGDSAVNTIRRIPIGPQARELTFPDRLSLSALHAPSYLEWNDADRTGLADRFFNDAFWFDQAGCSSPRFVIWCGGQGRAASADFFPRVAACARRRNFVASPALSMQKLVFASGAILDLPVTASVRLPELTVLTLDSVTGFEYGHPGGGFFFEADIAELADLAPALLPKHQTLTHAGFSTEQLQQLMSKLNGRALDRLVPVGQALQFGRFWDGHDLLLEFCRQVYVQN